MACAKNLEEQGATSVRAYIGHGLFSGDFYTNLANSSLVELVVTDSLKCYRPELENSSKVTRVPISKLIADEIYGTFGDNK
jgi:ribose-phosphate pyrophosphokinase